MKRRDNECVFCYMSGIDALVAVIDIMDTFVPLHFGLIKNIIDVLRII